VTSDEFQARLGSRAAAAMVALSPDLAGRLETYYRLLAAWNQKINLTGLDLDILDSETINRLFIEPLAAAEHAKEQSSVIDIGTGGGSPAIPFALAVSASSLVMVESRARKSVFLREAARAVELSNVRIETARFESLIRRPDLVEAHDILTVRAVRTDSEILSQLQSFVKPKGAIFLFQSARLPRPERPPQLVSRTRFALSQTIDSELEVLEKADH